jgi:hypothetical protein
LGQLPDFAGSGRLGMNLIANQCCSSEFLLLANAAGVQRDWDCRPKEDLGHERLGLAIHILLAGASLGCDDLGLCAPARRAAGKKKIPNSDGSSAVCLNRDFGAVRAGFTKTVAWNFAATYPLCW